MICHGKGRHEAPRADTYLTQKQIDPVPELQGKAKHTKKNANPIVAGAFVTDQKAFHGERLCPVGIYPVIDTDLTQDNIENDTLAADLEDL